MKRKVLDPVCCTSHQLQVHHCTLNWKPFNNARAHSKCTATQISFTKHFLRCTSSGDIECETQATKTGKTGVKKQPGHSAFPPHIDYLLHKAKSARDWDTLREKNTLVTQEKMHFLPKAVSKVCDMNFIVAKAGHAFRIILAKRSSEVRNQMDNNA